MAVEQKPGFSVLPFGIDGKPVGLGFWKWAKLSEHWLSICEDYLQAHGMVFDALWGGKLSHIQTKVTSVSGAALVSFSAQGRLVLSELLLAGLSPGAEQSLARMFVESLQRSTLHQVGGQSLNPFSGILSVEDRPLVALVPWPEPSVSEQDHNLVRELALHLAGAFFSMPGWGAKQ